MKKKHALLALLLALLLLAGCELPAALHKLPALLDRLPEMFEMKGVDTSALWRWLRNEPAPTPTPEPTPSPTPRPTGAEGRVLDMLEALVGDDRAGVRSVCDTLPGYRREEEAESDSLCRLYAAAYRNLSWRFLGSSEGNATATVNVEITAPDMRAVTEELTALLRAGSLEEDRAAAADRALESALAQAEERSRKSRVEITLGKRDGEWVVKGSSELYNALTGALVQCLTDFDLPMAEAEDVELKLKDKAMNYCLADNYLYSLVVKEVLPNAPGGFTLRAEARNKSSASIVIAVRNVLINGYVMDPDWHEELRGGETRTVELVWSRGEMAERGIESVKNIVFDLNGFQKHAWPVYPTTTQHCTFCPYERSLETTPLPTRENEQRLMDHRDAAFTVLSVDYEGCWGCTITVAIENRCREPLWFSVGSVKVNGESCDVGWSQYLPVGARSVDHIRIPAGTLMLQDASRADTVDFHLYVKAPDSLEEEDGVSEHGHYVLTAEELAG